MARTLSWRIEDACFNAWPALRCVIDGDWLLRFGEGHSRRSNSVNPLRAEAVLGTADLDWYEDLFRAQGLPLIVRLPSLLDSAIDDELTRRGFSAEGDSCVLHGELSSAALATDPDVEVHASASAEWCAAMSTLQGHAPARAANYRRVLAAVALPTGFATLRQNGETVAMAYGALHDRMLCCESVIVSAHHRGQGHGRRLMTSLFAWAAHHSAVSACLQVEAGNAAGRALYRSLGLGTESHRYHYRRAPDAAA